MRCNRDSGCYTIAKSTYPKLQGEANGAISSAQSDINSIIDSLGGLTIPNDYLGNKVKKKIDEIDKAFSSNVNELSTIKGKLDTFVTAKIKEHENHYNAWKKQEEERKKQENNN